MEVMRQRQEEFHGLDQELTEEDRIGWRVLVGWRGPPLLEEAAATTVVSMATR